MRKIVTALLAIFVAGWVVVGFAAGASAYVRHRPGCPSCGPVSPTIHTRTVHPQKTVTRYRDVSVVKNVHRVHRVVTVTMVQPVIHVHEVTRVHHHTVVYTRNSYEAMTAHLKPIRTVSRSTRNYYDCRCAR